MAGACRPFRGWYGLTLQSGQLLTPQSLMAPGSSHRHSRQNAFTDDLSDVPEKALRKTASLDGPSLDTSASRSSLLGSASGVPRPSLAATSPVPSRASILSGSQGGRPASSPPPVAGMTVEQLSELVRSVDAELAKRNASDRHS